MPGRELEMTLCIIQWRSAWAVGLGLAIWLVMVSAWADTPSPRQIRIVANGAWSDALSGDETPEVCQRFRLTESAVRRILQRSKPVSERAYAHDLDASRCHASGTARARHGDRIQWRIDAEGRVLLTAPGRPTSYRRYVGPALTETRKSPATSSR